MRSFFQAKMKVYYQTVIDGVASVVREARELLMARKKDSVTRALPTWPTAGLWWTGCFQKQSATGIGKHASSWTSHRLVTDLRLWICASPHRLAVTGAGLVGWLAGWLACLPACLLAALLGCSVAQLLACFLAWLACWLAGLLACYLPGWLACLLACWLHCAPLGKADAPSNTGTRVGRECETGGVKTLGRRTTTQAPMWGDNGRQGLTRPWGGEHTIQHGHTCGETREDKTSGRRTDHPTKGNEKGDKGRQGPGKADTPSNKGKQEGRQDLRKADTPSSKRKQEGRQCETRENIGRQREKRQDTTLKKRAHHPTHADMWETRGDKSSGMRTNTGTPREGEHTIQHRHTCGETMGDNESNGGHWETM